MIAALADTFHTTLIDIELAIATLCFLVAFVAVLFWARTQE